MTYVGQRRHFWGLVWDYGDRGGERGFSDSDIGAPAPSPKAQGLWLTFSITLRVILSVLKVVWPDSPSPWWGRRLLAAVLHTPVVRIKGRMPVVPTVQGSTPAARQEPSLTAALIVVSVAAPPTFVDMFWGQPPLRITHVPWKPAGVQPVGLRGSCEPVTGPQVGRAHPAFGQPDPVPLTLLSCLSFHPLFHSHPRPPWTSRQRFIFKEAMSLQSSGRA